MTEVELPEDKSGTAVAQSEPEAAAEPADESTSVDAPPEETPEPEITPEAKPGVIRIALDAMGGDNAPAAVVDGSIQAVEETSGMEVILVGDKEAVQAVLDERSYSGDRITIRHAEEVIEMDDSPSQALRKKRKSSIHIGVKMISDKEADAFISAGNTGAVMAVATVMLRNLEGIDRAAIAVILPTQKGNTLLLDAGANVVCKAEHLYQFGIMGSMYAQCALDLPTPKVGLLAIGEEDIKGNEVTKEALEMLTQSSINFIGNTEGKLLYRGHADVVVCDGFTGNIALKISESVAEMIGQFLKDMFKKSWRSKLAYALVKSSMQDFRKKVDHSEVGGAPLLGINGAVFISHGSSGPKSIKSAIMGAKKFIDENVNGHISESLIENKDILATKELKSEGLWDQVKRKMWKRSADDTEVT